DRPPPARARGPLPVLRVARVGGAHAELAAGQRHGGTRARHACAGSPSPARNARTAAAVGIGATAPRPVTASAAAAFAYRAASAGVSPLAIRARNAPSKQSPAPV